MFTKQSYPNEEVNGTEPSLSASIPWSQNVLKPVERSAEIFIVIFNKLECTQETLGKE